VNKVYVVTCGSYSDYHIVAIFETREAANEFAALYHESWNDPKEVSEFTLNQIARDAIRFVAYGHESDLDPDRLEFHHERMSTIEDELADPPRVNTSLNRKANIHGYGRTPDEARKSATDVWMRWKAEKAGIA
jgi:hypothetical protein